MAYIDHIRACNAHSLADFVPFRVGGARVGLIRRDTFLALRRFGRLFHVFEDLVHLDPGLRTYADRSDAVGEAIETLAADGVISRLRGEPYPVLERLGGAAVMEIDRGAATAFGIINRGFHLNGVVGTGEATRMWIARRAWDKATSPGMLDNLVAGGHPVGFSARDNMIKECGEEAGIAPELAATAVPAGMVSYVMEVEDGLRRHAFWTYDLAVPAEFRPVAVDGEVAEFIELPWREVAEIVERGPVEGPEGFKYNCNLVVIDWLIRTGRIDPDHPDYLELCTGLHAVFP